MIRQRRVTRPSGRIRRSYRHERARKSDNAGGRRFMWFVGCLVVVFLVVVVVAAYLIASGVH
jgi:hypothetical protein